MPITQDELKKLQAASTEKVWNATCDEIKKARGGKYPPDWFEKVIATGLIHKPFVG